MVLVKKCCCRFTLGQGTVGVGIWSTIESTVFLVFGAVILAALNPQNNLTDGEKRIVVAISLLMFAEGSFIMAACTLLFLAVKVENREFLLPWLTIRGVSVLVNIIYVIVVFFRGNGGIIEIVIVAGSVLLIYLYVVVLSCYQSDMGRSFSSEGVSLAPSPQIVRLTNSQPLETKAYSIPQPIVSAYACQQGMSSKVVPLNLRPQEAY